MVTVTSIARYPLQRTLLHSLRDPQIRGSDLLGRTAFLWFPTPRQQWMRAEVMVKLTWVLIFKKWSAGDTACGYHTPSILHSGNFRLSASHALHQTHSTPQPSPLPHWLSISSAATSKVPVLPPHPVLGNLRAFFKQIPSMFLVNGLAFLVESNVHTSSSGKLHLYWEFGSLPLLSPGCVVQACSRPREHLSPG